MMKETIGTKPRRLILTAMLVLICAAGAKAQSFANTHAKIDLRAEDDTLKAGQTAWIGLDFNMEPGWHIYWVNPGDAGDSPKVQWGLPKGFRAGDFRWPAPVRLMTGSVVDFGYEGRVLLEAPLEVPADYRPGSAINLTADVRYLICREVCIPAKAQAALRIPSKETAADAASARQLFQQTRDRWPKPLPAGAKAQAAFNGKNFVLTIDSGSPEMKASFFPLEEDQVDNDAPQTVKAAGSQVQITLKKSEQSQKPISALKGVVVFGSGRAVEVAAPVTNGR
jgi:DsbC/DsbD-like thiol-disulfide interchange protein